MLVDTTVNANLMERNFEVVYDKLHIAEIYISGY
jgi:hypothetical protein